ncbi:MAG: Na+/H+ antiporter subunit E [Phycisphaeraceae bacterium]|nr:Na+/H+ antiporter subunit E [Phycisphaeraceae bacterium]
MRLLVWNIFLALLWVLMTEEFSAANLLVGFGIGLVVLYMVRSVLQERKYFTDFLDIIGLIFYFFVELIIANFRMAYYTVMPLNRMRPGVISIPLEEMNETELTLLCNLITLTPGTLSLDVMEDKETGERRLFVHVMWYRDTESVRREIKRGFESRVLEALR